MIVALMKAKSQKAMSQKMMSRAMPAEQKPVRNPPNQRLQRSDYGLCDHRPLRLRDGLARERFRVGAGVRQGHRADETWDDSCDIRQLALGAASEACPLEAVAGQEVQFGSDFADVIPLGAGRVALALGDVGITGLAAALCVPQVLYALRRILTEHVQPACALGRLNRSLCCSGLLSGCPSVVLSLLVVDIETGKTECACAGSEPPLILRAGGSVEVVNAGLTALGMNADWSCQAADFLLKRGDALLLATDGITESRQANLEGSNKSLDCEGLAGLALDAFAAGGSPGQIARTVLGGAKEFAGGRFHDDASVLVAIQQ